MPLALDLIGKGYKIHGSTTTQSKLSLLQSNGITPFVIDIGDKKIDISGFSSADVLVIAIPSKNIEGFKNLIVELEKSEIGKVLFVSSTSVYPDTNAVVTEETETQNTPLAEIERLFLLNSNFKSTIVRFGGLFGYDRRPGNFIKPDRKMSNPEGYVNLIHRDDCIRIIEQIIAQDIWNEVLNACADSHPTRREFYVREAGKLGKVNVTFDEESKNNYKVVSSNKLKETLNYEFKHADLMNY